MSLVGLLLISIGTGGIKPCVSTFGADQFDIEDVFLLFIIGKYDTKLLFCILLFDQSGESGFYDYNSNFEELVFVLIGDVQCFNEDCYFLAFGLPAILMILSISKRGFL